MKLYKSLLFILSVVALLALLCAVFPQPSLRLCGIDLHFPSLDKIIRPSAEKKVTADELINAVEHEFVLTIDSVAQAHQDSLNYYNKFFAESPVRICCPDNNPEYLFPLFDALDNAGEKGVHVMHYGDSQIEGDRISGYLRAELQKRFGGFGPGLLPLLQPISSMAVRQTLSDSVAMYYAAGMMGSRAPHKRYGAMAQVAQLVSKDTLKCSIHSYKGKDIQNVTLFVGNVDSLLRVSVNGVYKTFNAANGMQTMSVGLSKRVSDVSMTFAGSGEVYGINIAGTTGVSVTNVPLRGSDGTFFSRIDPDAMKRMLLMLNTRLLIMEFGGNALPAIKDSASVDRWCNSFRNQVAYMQKMLPQATILVIGPADMSVKVDGEFKTHELLPYLVGQMKKSVTGSGAAFWDMFSVMGGSESMVAWVAHKPTWAAPDYIHFTKKGADRISQVLVETLMTYYNYRKFIQADNLTKQR